MLENNFDKINDELSSNNSNAVGHKKRDKSSRDKKKKNKLSFKIRLFKIFYY